MASKERQKFEEAASTSYRSAVWQHFGFAVDYNDQGTKMVTKTKTVCKYCLTTIPYITGNTTNMTTHLRRHHPDKSSASGAEDKVTRPKSQSSIADAFQKKYTFTSDKHKKITRAVGTFVAKALQPYSVVENDGFSYLMKTVDPRYAIPSRIYFTKTVIPDIYNKVRQNIVTDLAATNNLALTTDSWTSRATESYLTVTVHYMMNNEWQIKSAVLQTRPVYESHTSANLSDELKTTMTEWKLNRPNQTIPVTTDNAANIVNAVRDTDGLGPQIGCFAHVVNLAAKRAVAINSVSRLLGKIRKVVDFFHKSTTANHTLSVKQEMLNLPRHKLIHDVQTRWNTTHDMLERYIEQQAAVYSALLDKNLKTVAKDVAMLTDDEQKLAEELIKLLKPLKTVTTLMSSETTPTTSLILPLKELLLKSMSPLEEDSKTVKEAKMAIAKDLENRYTDPNLKSYLQKSTALDPRFKTLPSLDETSKFQVYRDLTSDILKMLQRQGHSQERNQQSHRKRRPPWQNCLGMFFNMKPRSSPFL
uniref:BED-type domain-containing protein n=1 Tax=Amphiprion ocellaris TaxID=80972 RepID=A0AAQ6A8D6_AMPOC